MNKFVLAIIVLGYSTTLSAQKPFEGEITYKLHSGIEKKDAELKVLFAPNRLKLRFKEKEEYDKEELLVWLDSAKTIILNTDSKSYQQKYLKQLPLQPKTTGRLIAGYETTPLQLPVNGLTNMFGEWINPANTTFYVADSLSFPIPERLAGNMEVMMIQKNKIILGASIRYTSTSNEDPAAVNSIDSLEEVYGKRDIIIEAEIITPKLFDEKEFLIPADFINGDSLKATMVDTVMKEEVTVDTTMMVPAPKKANKKKPAKKPVSKSPVKQSAIKRKR